MVKFQHRVRDPGIIAVFGDGAQGTQHDLLHAPAGEGRRVGRRHEPSTRHAIVKMGHRRQPSAQFRGALVLSRQRQPQKIHENLSADAFVLALQPP